MIWNKLQCIKLILDFSLVCLIFLFYMFYTLKLGVYAEDTRGSSATVRTRREFSENVRYNRSCIKNCQHWCWSSGSALDKYSSNVFRKSWQKVFTRRWDACKLRHSNTLCAGTHRPKISPRRMNRDTFSLRQRNHRPSDQDSRILKLTEKDTSSTGFRPSTKEASARCCRDLKNRSQDTLKKRNMWPTVRKSVLPVQATQIRWTPATALVPIYLLKNLVLEKASKIMPDT